MILNSSALTGVLLIFIRDEIPGLCY
jgi:hypothetical protein